MVIRIIFFLLLLIAYGSHAHELPLKTVYPFTPVAVATSFNLTHAEIEAEFNANAQYFDFSSWLGTKAKESGAKALISACTTAVDVEETCGQIDDFLKTAMVATSTCNTYALSHKTLYPNGLLPRFTGPVSFVDAVYSLEPAINHHDYSASEGISFDCVYAIKKLEVRLNS